MPRALLVTFLVWQTSHCFAHPRLAVPSPQLTEVLAQLGHAREIVATVEPVSAGVTLRSDVVRLGSLYQPSIERTVLSKPDWVVLDSSISSRTYRMALDAAELSVIEADIDSLEGLERETERLLATLFGEKRSKRLLRYRPCLEALASRPLDTKFSYLALAWTSPPIAFGRRTLLSDLIQAMGGESLVPISLSHPFPVISEEWLAPRRPDRLYFISYGDAKIARTEAEVAAKNIWPARPPELIALDSEIFSRASFSPIENLSRLRPHPAAPLPRSCLSLAKTR